MEEASYALAVAARPTLLKHVKDKSYENVCSVYSVVYADKSDITRNINCYAELQHIKGRHHGADKWEPLALILYRSENYNHTLALSDTVRITYLKWLLNESPWASAYVEKDAKQVFDDRIVTINTDIDCRVMGGGCVGFRRLWEYCQIVQTWYDLAIKGVNKNLAYFLAHASTGTKGDYITWEHYAWGHTNLNHVDLSKQGLLNFVNGTPVGKVDTYRTTGSYKSYSAMFQDGDGPMMSSWVANNFPYKDAEEVVEVVVKNPFAASKKSIAVTADDKPRIPYDQGVERMVEFSKLILKEIGYV